MGGLRHIWWNFVSSRKERIEQAKAKWKAGRFDTMPGDAEEFIPLPEKEKVVRYPLPGIPRERRVPYARR